MIKEDYVSFEVARLLKKKGFDEKCTHFYKNENYLVDLGYTNIHHYTNSDLVEEFVAPTFQTAIKWLKEVHNIFIGINIAYIDNKLTYLWIPCVIKQNHIDYPTMEEYMADSYEEACEAAIKYCLTNLKLWNGVRRMKMV